MILGLWNIWDNFLLLARWSELNSLFHLIILLQIIYIKKLFILQIRVKQYKWNELCIKDKIAYIIAMVLIGSGILIAFLSFFLNAFNIATGVLIYIAQCFTVGGSIIGVSIYFKTKLGEFQSKSIVSIEELIRKIIKDYKDD